jgi:hypothetical protein
MRPVACTRTRGNLRQLPQPDPAHASLRLARSLLPLALLALQKARDILVASAMKGAESRQHPADKLFTEIRAAAAAYPVTDEIYARGLRRHSLRDPPGKKDSYGDQINWECLLDKVPNGKDLHVMAKDGVRAFYTALLALDSKDLSPKLEYEVCKLIGLVSDEPHGVEDDPDPGADPDDDPGP